MVLLLATHWADLVQVIGHPPGVVLTIGETAVVLDPIDDGDIEIGATFRIRVSGAESNLAIALARLGLATRWVSRLGSDPIGHLVLQSLRNEGVDTDPVVLDPERPTAVTFKVRRDGSTSLIYYRRGSAASHLDPSDVPDSCFDGVTAVHLTGITMALGPGPRAAVLSVARRARASGLPVTFDLNYRSALWSTEEAAAACRTILHQTTWVLFGEDEGRALFGGSDPESTIERVREAGATGIVCRMAERGAAVAMEDRLDHVPAVRIGRIADDIGAGDAFDAGFMFGMVQGWTPSEGARLGTFLAARALSGTGDWEASPSWNEVDAWLRSATREFHRAMIRPFDWAPGHSLGLTSISSSLHHRADRFTGRPVDQYHLADAERAQLMIASAAMPQTTVQNRPLRQP